MKTKIIYKKRPKTIAQLKKDLTKVFNAYIRARDSQDGYFTCISSGKVLPVSQMHAGHFIPSTYSAVRFDEDNVHGQSNGDNLFKRGNLTEYRPRLVAKIGRERVEALEARRHDLWKPSREELEELIAKYTALVS